MKLLMEPIEVTVQDGHPAIVAWRGHRYPVLEIHETWTYRGRWWTDTHLHGDLRTYYRLLCRSVGLPRRDCDLEIFERDGSWILSRLLD